MAEKDIENKLIKFLVENNGYSYVELRTTADLENNMRKQLSKLNNREISLKEIDHINGEIKRRVGYQACYANKFNDILMSGVYGLDRNPIMLMSKSPSENIFQVSHQVIDRGARTRYDVTILMNGFPIIQIELKNVDVEINAAINQINRYIDTAFTGWYKYIQLFIVSNETNTRYAINNNTKLDKNFVFRWSDEKNCLIDNLYKFADTFLNRYNLCDILTKYIVKYKSDDGRMIVLRPYQIFAIKAAMEKIRKPMKLNKSNEDNGFIFHTTGSGKTLTSFKCVQLAAEEPMDKVAKVIFLVDRRDLDSQTTAEFKSIDAKLDIADTDNTEALLESFKNSKVIITTIQKFSIAVKKASKGEGEYSNVFGKYKDCKIVFIVDECHRTQFGKMHSDIDRYFTHCQYIGFTGTPIYDANALIPGQTTEALFGKELHTYRIENAIQDRNVLGFSVDYHNTVKTNSNIASASVEYTDNGSVDSLEILDNPIRISSIVKKIFDIHNKKTCNRRYTALFAVQSIPTLIKYYDEFKQVNATLPDGDKLKVSAIFTATDSDDASGMQSHKSKLKEIVDDFNSEFGVNCTTEDTFRAELTKSLKCKREPHLDILIVVNMFLTGFDSKMTNTLYVDKNLEWHGLLQAFSRTNRVESEKKPFGNIVCFRPIKDQVDEAIKLFNYGGTSTLITKTYESCVDNLIKIADSIMMSVPKDFNMANATETQKVEFVKSMRKLNHAVQETSQFEEFSWDTLNSKLTEEVYRTLVGQLKNIEYEVSTDTDKESILSYIDFCMELVEQDKIDLDYIKSLIENVDISTETSLETSVKSIRDIVEKSTSDNVINKRDLILRFLDKLVMAKKENKIDSQSDINSLFRQFVEAERDKEIKKLSLDTGLTMDEIQDEIDTYTLVGRIDGANIREKVKTNNPKLGVIKRRSVVESIKSFIPKVLKRFDFF